MFDKRPEKTSDVEYQAFVVAAAPVLLRAAILLSVDYHTAEDLVQTTFLRVARRWSVARESPFAYSRRVLVNLAYNEARRVARHPSVPLLAGNESTHPTADGTSALADHLTLVQAVRRLPKQQRSVVVLRFYLDLSVADTAQLLDLPEGTVKSATSRALDQLAQLLPRGLPEPVQGDIKCRTT
jgi:RNA polymerase sigma-70 factor (sigma-E family)